MYCVRAFFFLELCCLFFTHVYFTDNTSTRVSVASVCVLHIPSLTLQYSITMYTNYTYLIMALYGFNMKLQESTDKVVIHSLSGEPVLKTSCGGCCMNVCIKWYFYIDVSLHMMRSSLFMDLIYPSAYQVCNKKVYC
jgi:hypothetical protein